MTVIAMAQTAARTTDFIPGRPRPSKIEEARIAASRLGIDSQYSMLPVSPVIVWLTNTYSGRRMLTGYRNARAMLAKHSHSIL